MTYKTLEISKDTIRESTLATLQAMGLIPKGMNILTDEGWGPLAGNGTIPVTIGMEKEKGVRVTVRNKH